MNNELEKFFKVIGNLIMQMLCKALLIFLRGKGIGVSTEEECLAPLPLIFVYNKRHNSGTVT